MERTPAASRPASVASAAAHPASAASRPASVIALALLVALLGGTLVAALAFPLVGGVGLAAKAAADDFQALPQGLEAPSLSLRSQVLAADGSVLATFYKTNRIEAPFDTIPVTMRQAIVAIEDSRFYEHSGVDYKGTLRAAATNARSGGVTQGGSTLTQQYVKNALIEAANGDEAGQQAAVDRSLERKLREARYALAIEQTMTKDEILHGYLEIAYFGNGVYGIGTAARYYFDKPVSELSLAQSATLAGVVQNPTRFNVASKDKDVRAQVVERRNLVLGRMRDLGDISEATRRKTAAKPLQKVTVEKVGSGCEAASVVGPFFCDQVRHELESTDIGAALGATREERQTALFGGGLTIRTTLDPVAQKAAQKGVDAEVPSDDPSGVVAVSDVVEPGTGHIKAMAIDRRYGTESDKGETKLNYATGGSLGFQAGSTFKAFYLAAAIEEDIPLTTSIYSPAEYLPDQDKCDYRDENGVQQKVRNAEEREAGTFDLISGTHASVNTFYVQLAERTGQEKPMALAERMGVQHMTAAGLKPLDRFCSTVLGSLEVSPLAMAGAYATFAASGVHCEPRAILSITDRQGQELAVPPTECSRVMPAEVADTVTSVLRGVVQGDDLHRTGRSADFGRPVAGKTGTTNDSKAAWFVGYTPQLATAVWIGKPTPTPLTGVTIHGSYYKQVYGGSIPAAIFRRTMQGASDDLPVKDFPARAALATRYNSTPAAPPSTILGTGATVPDVAGASYYDAFVQLQAAGLRPTAGRIVSSSLPEGLVPYTYPRAGSSAAPGTTVYVYRSTGRASRYRAPTAAPTPRPRATATATPEPAATPTSSTTPKPKPTGGPEPRPTETK